ncbi:hypothetical protein ACIA8R_45820 [Nonomuraea sp. NPDC051191]|uniref:hypothetical protein n=1 Tax=Nonomuraea sp. NPDC051191 TaxID=3364372 RepID=UPI0037B0585E
MLAFASGAFATKALVRDPAEIPEDPSASAALALPVQGLTAWHLLRTAARVSPGETVVVDAAAGGVGTWRSSRPRSSTLDGSSAPPPPPTSVAWSSGSAPTPPP